MYIADSSNNRIRKVTVSSGIITTIAGSSTSDSFSGDGGAATSATLYYPDGVAVDTSGINIVIIVTAICWTVEKYFVLTLFSIIIN